MNDSEYIKRCFELAREGTGAVSPNPLVGCVITRDGKIISEGKHEKFGEPHAEANAINKYQGDLSGATLYCNLEPCCHTNKKTPPCAPLIIKSGIKKVVISNLDPNPEVAGKGVTMLRDAGIEVITGVEEAEGSRLNRFFFKHVTTKLPYITLKIASSLDGYISTSRDVQTWLTGEESGRFVHTLRAEYDAVLVGANTVNVDNPKLDVRYTTGRDPKKIVVDGNLSLDINSFMINNRPEIVTVYTSEKADMNKISYLRKKGVTVTLLKADDTGYVNMREILADIGRNGVSSLLVEGGAGVFSQFVASDLFDDIYILYAPVILGKGVNFASPDIRSKYKIKESRKIGEDLLVLLSR